MTQKALNTRLKTWAGEAYLKSKCSGEMERPRTLRSAWTDGEKRERKLTRQNMSTWPQKGQVINMKWPLGGKDRTQKEKRER